MPGRPCDLRWLRAGMSAVGRPRPAAGGGIEVEISAHRVVGWVNRFAGRNTGVAGLVAHPDRLEIVGGDGTTATIEVPFAPMSIGSREPVEALVSHLASIGLLGLVLVRGGAHSIGTAKDGVVLSSSTDRVRYRSTRPADSAVETTRSQPIAAAAIIVMAVAKTASVATTCAHSPVT